METGGPAAHAHAHTRAHTDDMLNGAATSELDGVPVRIVTWLWMLRRLTTRKSQGRMDLRGAKVCRGGMPRLLGITGSAKTSWFRKELVM